MSELKERLERLGELGTPAGADVIWKRVAHRLATPPEAPTEPDDHRRSRRVSSVVAISLALVVGLLVAGVIVLMRSTSRSHPSVAAGQGPSSTQAALDSEHTQTLLASVDSQRGLEITDVDQATTQTLVPGPMNLGPCNTCPLVRRANAVFFARDGRAYVLDDRLSAPRDLGPASFVFGSSDDHTVWIATTSQDSETVTKLDDRGNRTGGPWTIPDGYRISLNFLPKEIDGRILLLRGSLNPPHALYAWDPKSGKRVRLGDVLFTVDTHQQPGVPAGTLAWVPQDSCRRGLRQCALTISDLSSQDPAKNKTRTVDPPSDSNGFIGGGAFSPDGRTLAAFVGTTPTHQGPAARLVLVDVASGAVHEVRGGEISIAESYGFASWDPTGRWLFFGGFPQPLLVHRDGTDDAVALNLPASYTSVAIAAAPPAPTTTLQVPASAATPSTATTLTHFEGTHSGTELYALSKGRCSYLEHHLDSTFKLSDGKTWKYHADYCGTINSQVWNGAGTFTTHAEDDATLTGTFTSSAPLDPTGSAAGAPYTLDITGGTKRFHNASGSCTLDNHVRQIQFGVQEQSGSFVCDFALTP